MAQPSLLPQERKVQAIQNGTVIDHIPASRGVVIVKALNLASGDTVMSLGLNFKSKVRDRKDIVKIENRELTPEELAQIAVIAPGATVNIIRNYSVVDKSTPEIPNEIIGLSQCPNPNCISNHEPIKPHFKITKSALRCKYCEKRFSLDDLAF